jgi:hypothetical protein
MSFYNRERAVKLSRNIFRVSGVYGILILCPQLFREKAFTIDGIVMNHPEFFYGFFLVSLAFQIVFLIISTDPVKYRPVMLACFIEKGGYFISCMFLFLHGRIAPVMLIASAPDALMLSLFIYSFFVTSKFTNSLI